MRWTLFILLFTIVPALGQNYQPLNSGSLQVFYQEDSYEPYGRGNMWGTRIDSITIGVGSDTSYHNYGIPRDTAFENSYNMGEECIWWNAPNWNGYDTRIDTIGRTWFFNAANDSILLWHAAPLDSFWNAYTYENGDFLLATVTSIGWVDDVWIADSVKTIQFERISNGAVVEDIMNEVVLELYKTAGFRNMIDFVWFPLNPIIIHQVDPNTINRWPVGISSPSVGNGYRHSLRCDDSDWTGMDITTQYTSKLITGVAPFGNDGQMSVTAIRHTQTRTETASQSSPYSVVYSEVEVENLNYIYTPGPDTFSTLIQNESGNLMPREKNALYDFFFSGTQMECATPVVKVTDCQWPFEWMPTEGDSCFPSYMFYPFECNTVQDYYFLPYFGSIGSYSMSVEYNAEQPECTGSMPWFKNDLVECGISYMVDVPSVEEDEVAVYPVPTSDYFSISSEQYTINNLRVFDAQGRLAHQSVGQSNAITIDCQNWPKGLYILQVETQKGPATKRLILQ